MEAKSSGWWEGNYLEEQAGDPNDEHESERGKLNLCIYCMYIKQYIYLYTYYISISIYIYKYVCTHTHTHENQIYYISIHELYISSLSQDVCLTIMEIK